MLYQRLIPSLLLKDNRLVKGVRYRDYRDAGNPATTAKAHNHQGADELILLDIDASKENRGPDIDVIRLVAEQCFMPLCVGGGIRSLADATQCMKAGADKLCLTTTALDNPELITRLAHHFGSQAVVVSIDISRNGNGHAMVYDHRNGTIVMGLDPLEWAKKAVSLGAGEIRIMSVDREGSLQGYDLEIFKIIREAVDVPIILEGGAGTLDHLESAYKNGVDGVAVGAMLVFSDANLVKIKHHMVSHNCNIRA